MLWGLSSALDLLSEYEKVNSLLGLKEINILLIGSTDGRHLLKTMSALRRHSVDDAKINFFVMDLAIEFVARQLLLLTIALEPEDRLGSQEKARLWMEVYGNTLLRPVTAKYVMSKAVQLIHMVTNNEYLNKRMPLVDLNQVKYKEIDKMENIFKYWIKNRYNIVKIWDIKLRNSLGTRYDAKDGIFDWDYNMKLRDIEGGERLCSSEYKMWRKTGIAFTWMETEYSVGNPTLAVGIGSIGDTLFSHGYMGDMVSGPYFAFGTDSEEKKMLENRNGHNVRRATDITERNLQRIFHELEHGNPPNDQYSSPIDMGLVMMKPGNVDVDREVKLDYEPDRTPEDYSAIPVPNCKVIFLPGNALETYSKKAKYKEFFDIVFVAQNFFKFLDVEIVSMAKPSGCLIIETRKFVINLDKEIGLFGKEVRSKLEEIGWEEVIKCHFRRDDHAVCRKGRGGAQQKHRSSFEVEEQDSNSSKLKYFEAEKLEKLEKTPNQNEKDAEANQSMEKDQKLIKGIIETDHGHSDNKIWGKEDEVSTEFKEMRGDILTESKPIQNSDTNISPQKDTVISESTATGPVESESSGMRHDENHDVLSEQQLQDMEKPETKIAECGDVSPVKGQLTMGGIDCCNKLLEN